MIRSLTQQQKSRLKEFIDKWTNIGLSTKPANRALAENGVRRAYKIAGLKAPKIVWCSSPLSQALTRVTIVRALRGKDSVGESVRDLVWESVWNSVRDLVGESVEDLVKDSVMDSVWNSVRDLVGESVKDSVMDSVWNSVRDLVWESVWESVGESVGNLVEESVWESVRNSVRDLVEESVWESVRNSVRDLVGESVGHLVEESVGESVGDLVEESVGHLVWDSVRVSGYGQHDAYWLAFYEYFREVCGLERQTQKLLGIWQVSKNAGWWLPHENICWISERHNTLLLNEQGRLHADGKMALEYPDGWGVYALNGVRVPRKLVMTPQNKLTVDQILSYDNADVRAEAIRKYGIERMLSKGKVVDSYKSYSNKWIHKSEYELVDMSPIMTSLDYAPYLKMKNQSVEGVFHVEAVSRSCKTIQEAINFRTKTKNALIIDIK